MSNQLSEHEQDALHEFRVLCMEMGWTATGDPAKWLRSKWQSLHARYGPIESWRAEAEINRQAWLKAIAYGAGLADALRNIEALICDKPLCGHFTAEEIRAVVHKALEPTHD